MLNKYILLRQNLKVISLVVRQHFLAVKGMKKKSKKNL